MTENIASEELRKRRIETMVKLQESIDEYLEAWKTSAREEDFEAILMAAELFGVSSKRIFENFKIGEGEQVLILLTFLEKMLENGMAQIGEHGLKF